MESVFFIESKFKIFIRIIFILILVFLFAEDENFFFEDVLFSLDEESKEDEIKLKFKIFVKVFV